MVQEMADDLYPNRIPANFTGTVASYIGHPSNLAAWDQLCARFPNSKKIKIVTNGTLNDGDVYDCESGVHTPVQATPELAVKWTVMRRQAGLFDPTVYCGKNTWWTPIKQAFDAARVPYPSFWVADYAHGETIPPGAVGLQYKDVPPDYSHMIDDWPKQAPALTPGPTPNRKLGIMEIIIRDKAQGGDGNGWIVYGYGQVHPLNFKDFEDYRNAGVPVYLLNPQLATATIVNFGGDPNSVTP